MASETPSPSSSSSSYVSALCICDHITPGMSRVIVLGSGASEGIPRVSCITQNPITCAVCAKAACTLSTIPPGLSTWPAFTQEDRKNRRRTTGIIVQHPHPDGRIRNILVDAGKGFWESALSLFPKFGIQKIDAVILTHEHADAMLGLDDLRDFSSIYKYNLPIYLTARDLQTAKETFPYLFRKGEKPVPTLDFKEIDGISPFSIDGIEELVITPLPVYHGTHYISLGFKFGRTFSYISDCSRVPDSTRRLMHGTEVLILDTLRDLFDGASIAHMTLGQSIEEATIIAPQRQVYFTGIGHCLDHEETNNRLSKWPGVRPFSMALAFDGLAFEISF